MKHFSLLILATALAINIIGCGEKDSVHQHEVKVASMESEQNFDTQPEDSMEYEVTKSDKEWRQLLSSAEYRICAIKERKCLM